MSEQIEAPVLGSYQKTQIKLLRACSIADLGGVNAEHVKQSNSSQVPKRDEDVISHVPCVTLGGQLFKRQKKMTDNEKIVREMICHENAMTNHRISWLNTIQGLLFTALGFSWNKEIYLSYLICWLGAAVAAVSWVALYCSEETKKRLYEGCRRGNRGLWYPDVVGYRNKKWHIRYGSPWRALPILFLAAWFFVLVILILNPYEIKICAAKQVIDKTQEIDSLSLFRDLSTVPPGETS